MYRSTNCTLSVLHFLRSARFVRMIVARACDADVPAMVSMVQSMGWPQREADLQFALDAGSVWVAKASRGGGAIAMAAWWAYGTNEARLGLVIVHQEHQRQGLAGLLVNRCLEEARGRRVSLLSTTDGLQLYRNTGFEKIGGSRRYQGKIVGDLEPDARVRAAKSNEFSKICELDREASGFDRKTVLEHIATLGRMFLLEHNGEMTGFVMTRPFLHGTVVGPMIAADANDAIALFNSICIQGEARIDCLSGQQKFAQHIAACGVEAHEESPIMVNARPRDELHSTRYFSMASHAWG
ncbi:MAG: GNAT family N-acetyltransferase [Pseudomonadota bacterium]